MNTENGSNGSHILRGLGVTIADQPGIPFQSLTGRLSLLLGRTVIDKTRLHGMFDFTLEWTPEEQAETAGDATGEPARPTTELSIGSTIRTRLQQQLGLKLESGRGPVAYLVIDHIERPENN